MANIQNVVNSILATDLKDSRIPTLTDTNFQEVGNAILKYQHTTNDFLNALVNKIAFQIISPLRTFDNPLVELKKGAKPYGKDIEHAHINPAKAETYDIDKGTELLKVVRPDVASEYFRLNRQDQYPVSITRQEIKHAFTSPEAMETLINGIKNSLISGDNIDEFILMKDLYTQGVTDGKLQHLELPAEATPKEILSNVRNLSSAFKFPSQQYNSYNQLNKTEIEAGTMTARITWAPLDTQVILMRSDVINDIDLNVLAGVFNLTKAELQTRIIEVDNFGGTATVESGEVEILAVIQDRALTQVYDDENYMDDFYNAKNGVYNYYWNHWQVMGLSTLANGVAITKPVTPEA